MEVNVTERRRRPRISTMILCELRVGSDAPTIVRVRDLSECGIKIATAAPMQLGAAVKVRLPASSEWILARVAWRTKGTAGISFLRAIDLPQISGAHTPEDTREPFMARSLRLG